MLIFSTTNEGAKIDMLCVTTTWRNDNPDTIWNKLARRLDREPSNEEAKQEVLRILRETK